MATGELPARPGASRPATIDVPSYETPAVPVAPDPSAVPDAALPAVPAASAADPPAEPKPPPRRLNAAELVTESTRLAVGAVVATGRGVRAIIEQAVAVVDHDDRQRAVVSSVEPDAPPAHLGNGRAGDARAGGSVLPTLDRPAESPSPASAPPSAPVAALRPSPPPDTVIGALPTAALGASLHAQRQVLAAIAESRERYGPALTWMLEAPAVSAVYQRARANVFEWYFRGAADKEEGATLAMASLKEVSDGGLGYVFANIDLNVILHGFDINPLLENLELSDVIMSSTGGLATEALDNVRSQGVTVDDVIARISNRVLRRRPEKVPDGPEGRYGVAQEFPPWTTR